MLMLIGNHNTVSIYIFFSNFDYDMDKKTAANKKQILSNQKTTQFHKYILNTCYQFQANSE